MINLKISNLKEEKGFSLIEALVALLIIGIITAVTLPCFFRFYSGAELKTAGRKVASVLRAAKSYAEAKNVDYYVDFNMPASHILRMTIYEGSISSGNEVGKAEKLSLSSKIQFTVNFGGATPTAALFTPQGTSNGGTVEVTNSKRNKEVDISVCAATARVSISDIKPPD